MLNHMLRSGLIAATWACAIPATAPAGRAAELDMQSARVFVGDLDLATAAGALALHARITAAIRFVCGPVEPGLAASRERAACMADAGTRASRVEQALRADAARRAFATR